jgi:hypothetical protein
MIVVFQMLSNLLSLSRRLARRLPVSGVLAVILSKCLVTYKES